MDAEKILSKQIIESLPWCFHLKDEKNIQIFCNTSDKGLKYCAVFEKDHDAIDFTLYFEVEFIGDKSYYELAHVSSTDSLNEMWKIAYDIAKKNEKLAFEHYLKINKQEVK